jgi:hypothetical protein
MAQDQVSLYNLACSAIGTRARIADPAEVSREAEICQLWYPIVRVQVLQAAHWPSARGTANLTKVATRDLNVAWADGDPAPDWLYTYTLPFDFLYPRFINNYQQFELGIRTTTRVLFSNNDPTRLDYTKDQTNIATWDSMLYNAIANALAAAIAMPLHGKAARAKLSLELANRAIMEARANMANRDNRQLESVPDWLSIRGVGQPSAISAYLYPFGPLLTMTSFVI